jgi:cell division protein FtsL
MNTIILLLISIWVVQSLIFIFWIIQTEKLTKFFQVNQRVLKMTCQILDKLYELEKADQEKKEKVNAK